MRKRSWPQRRDLAVHLLARLSLLAALAVLGALFIGGAATSQASESSGTTAGASESSQPDLRDRARPVGLLLGAVVISGGLVVLTIGAVRPSASQERRRYAELVDH